MNRIDRFSAFGLIAARQAIDKSNLNDDTVFQMRFINRRWHAQRMIFTNGRWEPRRTPFQNNEELTNNLFVELLKHILSKATTSLSALISAGEVLTISLNVFYMCFVFQKIFARYLRKRASRTHGHTNK